MPGKNDRPAKYVQDAEIEEKDDLFSLRTLRLRVILPFWLSSPDCGRYFA